MVEDLELYCIFVRDVMNFAKLMGMINNTGNNYNLMTNDRVIEKDELKTKHSQSERNPNFEILRFLAMLFIVFWHFIVHGIMHCILPESKIIVNSTSFIGCANYFISEYIVIITSVAVNCYILISGYFLVKSSFKFTRITKVWAQTFFYAVAICLILYFTTSGMVGVKDIIKSLTPIRSRSYWFVSIYCGMIILSPFLSKLANSITKKGYECLLLALFFLNAAFCYGPVYGGEFSLSWFVFLFFVAGYVRLYGFPLKRNYGKLSFLFSIILFLSILIDSFWKVVFLKKTIAYSSIHYNGLCFFFSLFLFLWFKEHVFKRNLLNNLIVRFAPYTFGVYLIHDNDYIRSILWYKEFNPSNYINSSLLIPIMFGACIAIFGACIFLDFIRSKIFRYLKVDKFIDIITSKMVLLVKYCLLSIEKLILK